MNALKDNPTKRCSDCRRQKPAVNFGANRSAADGLARQCLECTRAADRRRQPRHQAAKQIRQKRRRKEERSREAAEYMSKGTGTATPHCSDIITGFWKKSDCEPFVNLLVDHLRDCKKSSNSNLVRRTINRVMEKTDEYWKARQVDLSLLSQDELGRRVQNLLREPFERWRATRLADGHSATQDEFAELFCQERFG